MKVIIVGTSGSGKSTLAKKISQKIGADHIELDSIYNQPNWQSIDTEEFIEIVDGKTAKESWVICGNYFSRLGLDFWKKADVVIWLDYPFHKVFSRVVLRSIKRGATRQILWNGNRESLYKNFLTSDSIILHMLKTWKKQRRRYKPIFDKSKLGDTKLLRLKSGKEADELLEGIEHK